MLSRPKIRTTWFRNRPAVLLVAGVAVLGLVAGAVVLFVVPDGSTDGSTGGPAPEAAAKPWRLVWSDEFDRPELDRKKWNAEDDSTYGDGGKTVSCLMDRPENLALEKGRLVLSAARESTPLNCGGNDRRFPQGRSYSSAHLTTKGLHEWTYGRFEIRATLPTAAGTSKGLWPAFWLRPTSGGTGELDVLEALGSAPGENEWNKAHQAIWYDYTGTHPHQQSTYTFPAGAQPSTGMHTYAAEWEPGSIRWFVDGKEVYSRDSGTTPWLDEAFNKPFYLRLNLAVGGSWPGDPTAATALPARFQVDHVRVYQR